METGAFDKSLVLTEDMSLYDVTKSKQTCGLTHFDTNMYLFNISALVYL